MTQRWIRVNESLRIDLMQLKAIFRPHWMDVEPQTGGAVLDLGNGVQAVVDEEELAKIEMKLDWHWEENPNR